MCEPSGAGLVALVLGSGGFRPVCELQVILAFSALSPLVPLLDQGMEHVAVLSSLTDVPPPPTF